MIDIALVAKHAHLNELGCNVRSYQKPFDKVFDTLLVLAVQHRLLIVDQPVARRSKIPKVP